MGFRYEPVESQRSGLRPILKAEQLETDDVFLDEEAARGFLGNFRKRFSGFINRKP